MLATCLLIPAFTVLSWLCPGHRCVWPAELKDSWPGPWRQGVFLPQEPSVPFAAQSPGRVPQHPAATGGCSVMAGFAWLAGAADSHTCDRLCSLTLGRVSESASTRHSDNHCRLVWAWEGADGDRGLGQSQLPVPLRACKRISQESLQEAD